MGGELNNRTFILYTTEEGGAWHAAACTHAEYEGIVQRRQININMFGNVMVEPVVVALLTVIDDNYDFILGGSRG